MAEGAHAGSPGGIGHSIFFEDEEAADNEAYMLNKGWAAGFAAGIERAAQHVATWCQDDECIQPSYPHLVKAIRALAPVPDSPELSYAGKVVAVDWEAHETRITVLVPRSLRVWLTGPVTIAGEALTPLSDAEVRGMAPARRAVESPPATGATLSPTEPPR